MDNFTRQHLNLHDQRIVALEDEIYLRAVQEERENIDIVNFISNAMNHAVSLLNIIILTGHTGDFAIYQIMEDSISEFWDNSLHEYSIPNCIFQGYNLNVGCSVVLAHQERLQYPGPSRPSTSSRA